MQVMFAKSDIYRNSPAVFGETLPPPVQTASGGGEPGKSQSTPAMVWVGFVAILVVMRILWEKAK